MLLEWSDPTRIERILHIDSPEGLIWVINVNDEHAWPEYKYLDVVLAALSDPRRNQVWVRVGETSARHAHDAKLTSNQAKGAARWFDLVRELAGMKPQIFEPAFRNAKIKEFAQAGRGSPPSIRLALRRFWQRGQDEFALYYDSNYCGTPKNNKPRKITCRLGRPPGKDKGPGFKLNPEEHLPGMRAAWNLFYKPNLKTQLEQARMYYLLRYDPKNTFIDAKGRARIKPGASVITKDQFRFWYKKEHSVAKTAKARGGDRFYRQKVKPRTSGSHMEVFGNGARYQVDSTTGDVYLVSSLDRTRIIGRPTIYLVVDDGTGLIVGVHIGIEPPNYWGLALALLNVIADKKAFYAKYDIHLEPEELFTAPLPNDLLADRGAEFRSSKVGILIGKLIKSIHNAQAQRGDAKGLVESMFHTLDVKYGPYIPGYVDPGEYAPRDGAQYKLDACLTLREFTKIVLAQINCRNQEVRRDKKRLLLHTMAVKDGIPNAPLPLWNWGEENLPGGGVERDPAYVRKVLLPSAPVIATHAGFKFDEGLPAESMILYDYPEDLSDEAVDWTRAARSFEASYDPRRMDSLILHTGSELGRDLEVFLTEPHRHLQDRSLNEINALYMKVHRNDASQNSNAMDAKLHATQVLDETSKSAKKAAAAARKLKPQSAAKRIYDIPENRAAARELHGRDEMLTPSLADKPPAPNSLVPELPKPNDAAYPDQSALLRQIMGGHRAPEPDGTPEADTKTDAQRNEE